MKRSAENILASYIDALHPIIYINHFDFKVIDAAIAHVGQGAKCVEFNNALGLVDFKTKSPMKGCSLEEFLKLTMDDGFEQQTFLILKDVHRELDNPKVIAYLKRIAENNLYNENYSATIFIISEVTVIPRELENYITIFDIPLPTIDEIRGIIRAFITDMEIEVDADTIDEIALSFKGLNEFQIRQILTLAYQDGGCITRGDKALILKEKEQFIKKSGMLEIVNFSESIEDIGGLENLKDWLYRKAFIFRELDKAIKFGVDVPKGIMIIGMPGCGKSLTAKATASLFEIPLVRLDVGRLLGKYVGESEENMRNALKLSEAISPCVLWIDEIEKAFAGVGGEGGGNDVTTRLFGQFLTWMQEKENTVFIVATANDISRLPPEFLRKGRFDELFFVDLPNGTERRKILEIHLKKRKKWNENIDSIALIKETEGYNGADLEAVVKDTIERAFIEGRTTITTADLIRSIKDNGRLRPTTLGGHQWRTADGENCTVHTRDGRTYTGVVLNTEPSAHVADDKVEQVEKNMEILLDENVDTKDDVAGLGIQTGDIIAMDPRTVITKSGYIKSRFLDDKLSASVLLGLARAVAAGEVKLARKVSLLFTVYEEVGHGGAFVPADTCEMISVDMGCVGDDLGCTERMVSICAKDSGGPYNYELVSALADTAKLLSLDYAIDVYPHYGSDVEATLRAGYDIRHGLIGPGVYASHNYERSHMDGVRNTYELLRAYVGE